MTEPYVEREPTRRIDPDPMEFVAQVESGAPFDFTVEEAEIELAVLEFEEAVREQERELAIAARKAETVERLRVRR